MSDQTDAETEAAPVELPEPERLHGALVSHGLDNDVLFPERENYVALLKALRADGYFMAIDLCGVDYLTHPGRTLPDGVVAERFEVVTQLIRHSDGSRLRVRVQVPAQEPSIASVCDLFPGVEAMEREAYDMFGIVFEGHPDLTRILMPDEWSGHPLRKDYAVGRIPVQFKAAPIRGTREVQR
ncbi:MAG: NADH-quinone oxidoreductase subunit C [Actinobacteria bacterium]|nr:NADH-quinone oxidoreductase subunit C [Actinomycetota bacterium]